MGLDIHVNFVSARANGFSLFSQFANVRIVRASWTVPGKRDYPRIVRQNVLSIATMKFISER